MHLPRPKTFSALSYHNFRLFWGGAILSNTGDFMQMMAQSWLVLELTNSAFLLGAIGFCQAAPRLILGPVAGVIADRFDRRYLQIYMQTIAMIQAFVFGILVVGHWIKYWQVVVLVIILGLANALNQIAKQAMISSLVPRSELTNAVALNSSVINLSRILGPSLAGILLGIIGVSGILFLNGISFIFILISLFMMDLPKEAPKASYPSMRKDLAEGINFIRLSRPILFTILLAYLIAGFGYSYVRFLPIWARDILKIGPTGFGLLMAAPGVGAVAAALTVASLGNMKKRHRVIFSAAVTFGVVIGVFAYSTNITLSLVTLFLAGYTQMVFRNVSNSSVQLATPDSLLGRVMSIFLLDVGLWSLGTLFMGMLMEATSPPMALGIGGGICILSALSFWFFYNRGTPSRVAHAPQAVPTAPRPRVNESLEEDPTSVILKSEDL